MLCGELQRLYKVEIGEAEPKVEGKQRLKKAIDDKQIIFYGVWQDDCLIGCCSITRGFSTFDYLPSGTFANRLNNYKTSKGTIQFPFNKPIDYELITAIVLWTVEQATEKKNKL